MLQQQSHELTQLSKTEMLRLNHTHMRNTNSFVGEKTESEEDQLHVYPTNKRHGQ